MGKCNKSSIYDNRANNLTEMKKWKNDNKQVIWHELTQIFHLV